MCNKQRGQKMAIGQVCTRKASLAPSLSFPSTRSSTTILGRKRIAVAPASAAPAAASPGPHSPVRALRKQRSTRLHMGDSGCLLESLPEDILIKVLCKVHHSDLRQLLLVSKQVSEATIVARELHFKFATPSAKAGLRDEECGEDNDVRWAPKQRRVAGRPRHSRGKDLCGIAVNLTAAFSSVDSEI